ncbi:MAG: DMT family transporter [Burkholderiaceae bacterium]
MSTESIMAPMLAALGSLCFGLALVTGRLGLRHLDARSGALVSIPSAAVLLSMAAPFALRTDGFDGRAVWIFVAVGLFFPALVTLLTFRSNELLGPTLTSAVSGTAPLFAIGIAGLVLGERLPPARRFARSAWSWASRCCAWSAAAGRRCDRDGACCGRLRAPWCAGSRRRVPRRACSCGRTPSRPS